MGGKEKQKKETTNNRQVTFGKAAPPAGSNENLLIQQIIDKQR